MCRLNTRVPTTTCKPPSDSTTSAQPALTSRTHFHKARRYSLQPQTQSRRNQQPTPRTAQPLEEGLREGGAGRGTAESHLRPASASPRGTTAPRAPRAVPVATGSRARADSGDAQGRVSGGPAGALRKGLGSSADSPGGTASPPCGHGAGGRGDGCKRADSASVAVTWRGGSEEGLPSCCRAVGCSSLTARLFCFPNQRYSVGYC